MRRRSSGQERRHFRELAGFCTSLLRSELVTLGSAWQSPSRPRRFRIGLLLSELATAVRFWFGSLGFRRLYTCLLRSELATGTQGLAARRRKRRFEKSVEDCEVWAQLAPNRGRGRGGYVMPQVAGVVLAKGSAGTKVRAMWGALGCCGYRCQGVMPQRACQTSRLDEGAYNACCPEPRRSGKNSRPRKVFTLPHSAA